MQLSESIEKTRFFFHKALKNLKSLFFGGYQKLPKVVSFNPFSCARSNHHTDHYYAEFYNEWECDIEKAMKMKKKSVAESEETVTREEEKESCIIPMPPMSPVKKKEEGLKEQKIKKSYNSRKGEQEQCSKKKGDAGYSLAKKMKELEMMDVGDVEHVLDVEEALHYYSRLRSPVYLDMVDKFFTDMQASASINSSTRRLGSIRL